MDPRLKLVYTTTIFTNIFTTLVTIVTAAPTIRIDCTETNHCRCCLLAREIFCRRYHPLAAVPHPDPPPALAAVPPAVAVGAAEGGAGEAVAVGCAAAVHAPRVGEGVELLAAGPGPVPGVAGVLRLVPLIVNCNISFHSFNRAEMWRG